MHGEAMPQYLQGDFINEEKVAKKPSMAIELENPEMIVLE